MWTLSVLVHLLTSSFSPNIKGRTACSTEVLWSKPHGSPFCELYTNYSALLFIGLSENSEWDLPARFIHLQLVFIYKPDFFCNTSTLSSPRISNHRLLSYNPPLAGHDCPSRVTHITKLDLHASCLLMQLCPANLHIMMRSLCRENVDECLEISGVNVNIRFWHADNPSKCWRLYPWLQNRSCKILL